MGLFTAIFGGKRSSEESKNLNNTLLTNALSPALSSVTDSTNALTKLFSGDTSGFDSYKKAGGFDWLTRQGTNGILGAGAARGLLRSGSTSKALVNYGNNMANQYLNDYIQSLMGRAGVGLGAASTIADAGRYSKAKASEDTGNFGKFLGNAAAFIGLSDRRPKENIVEVGILDTGLRLYEYNYKGDNTRFVGVMADEVAALAPDALGPIWNSYQTVNYSKIEGLENGPIRLTP